MSFLAKLFTSKIKILYHRIKNIKLKFSIYKYEKYCFDECRVLCVGLDLHGMEWPLVISQLGIAQPEPLALQPGIDKPRERIKLPWPSKLIDKGSL